MKRIEFNNYKKKMGDLIIEELKKKKKKKKTQKDMLFDRFSEEQRNTYYLLHTASMMHGTIWEIVFFNFRDWEHIKKMDGKSDKRKIIMELKNKPKTFNSNAKKGTKQVIFELQKEYPLYSCIVGFINDDKNTNFIDNKNKIHYMGGDVLFKYVFGEEYYKEIREEVKKILFSFFDQKK